MHTGQLLLLLFISSAFHCSLQVDSLSLAENSADSNLIFDMQDVLQLFSAQTSLLSKEDSSTVHTNPKPSLLGAHLKEIENLMEISLFTYITNQIANSPEEVFVNDNQIFTNPSVHSIATQDSPIEIPEPFFQENEETFQLKKYGNDELYRSTKNDTNEYNNLDQQQEISQLDPIRINEALRDVVIIDERLNRFLVPLVLSAIDDLERNSSLNSFTVVGHIEAAEALQGSALTALRGVYDDKDDEGFTFSFAKLKEDQEEGQSTYILGFCLIILTLSSVGFVLKKLNEKKELSMITRSEEEERSWYVEARDI